MAAMIGSLLAGAQQVVSFTGSWIESESSPGRPGRGRGGRGGGRQQARWGRGWLESPGLDHWTTGPLEAPLHFPPFVRLFPRNSPDQDSLRQASRPSASDKDKDTTRLAWPALARPGLGRCWPSKTNTTPLDNDKCSLRQRILPQLPCLRPRGGSRAAWDEGGWLVCTALPATDRRTSSQPAGNDWQASTSDTAGVEQAAGRDSLSPERCNDAQRKRRAKCKPGLDAAILRGTGSAISKRRDNNPPAWNSLASIRRVAPSRAPVLQGARQAQGPRPKREGVVADRVVLVVDHGWLGSRSPARKSPFALRWRSPFQNCFKTCPRPPKPARVSAP